MDELIIRYYFILINFILNKYFKVLIIGSNLDFIVGFLSCIFWYFGLVGLLIILFVNFSSSLVVFKNCFCEFFFISCLIVVNIEVIVYWKLLVLM